jgi:guanosine-3',5'-bis(diphosphate) 3'-pyrophosphohydrolase
MKVDSKVLELAIIFATEKHKGIVRKGDGRPYILHPLSVLLTLNQFKKSKNQFLLGTACVLHDVVEDCDVTLEEIAKHFSHNVASLVEELTNDNEKLKAMGKANYLLDKMIGMSTYALCIKLCDRLDNIKDMATMNEDFKTKYTEQTKFIINGLQKSRDLTKTHKKIIKAINKHLN